MEKKTLVLDADAVDTLLVLLASMSEKSFTVLEQLQEAGEPVDPGFAMQTIAVHSLYKHFRKANKKFEVAELEKLFEIDPYGNAELDLGLTKEE